MRTALACALLLLAVPAAQAGDSYSFEVGGHRVYIDTPRDCDSLSCVSVSVPGVFQYGPKSGKRKRDETRLEDDDDDVAPPRKPDANASVSPQAPASNAQPAAPVKPDRQTASPAPALAPSASEQPKAAERPAPAAASPKPATATAAPDSRPAGDAGKAVVATAPAAAPLPAQETPQPAPQAANNTPVGVWLTEEREGKVRIEPCGSNLCGYSVNTRTNANGEKILINMRPSGKKWSGRIHDPKGGSTYDSTIAMKGPDRLRVRGCAFGGMFCGGQTWTRVE